MDNPKTCTQWREVGIKRGDSIKSAKRGLTVLLAAIALAFMTPRYGPWFLASLVVGLASLLFVVFDLVRIHRNERHFQRWEFDDRRLERTHRAENEIASNPTVYAFDALETVGISLGIVGLFQRGDSQLLEMVEIEDFPDRATLDDLLNRMAARDVKIEFEDDSLDTAVYGQE